MEVARQTVSLLAVQGGQVPRDVLADSLDLGQFAG